jgi:two-component system chemotaxis response regulator CheB
MTQAPRHEEVTGFTCPTCGGAIWELQDKQGGLLFRCRIQHTFSMGGLLAAHATVRSNSFEAARQKLAEGAALKRHLAARAREMAHPHAAAQLDAEAARLEAEAATLDRVRQAGGE